MKTNPLELIRAFKSLSFPQQLPIIIAFVLGIGRLYLRFRHYLDDKRKRQIESIEGYLNPNRIENYALSKAMQKTLKAEREDQIFAHVRGYSLRAGLREKLTPIILAPNAPVSWSQVKGAQSYLGIGRGKLLVSYKAWDIGMRRLSPFISVVCLSIALGLWVIMAKHEPMTMMESVIAGSISIALVAATSLTVSWSVGFDTALRIEHWLNLQGK